MKMPGIIVGVDGSTHSRRALEWAMKEAALRETPLTVMTVHALIRGYFGGGMVEFPTDHELAEKAGKVVQADVDAAVRDLRGSAPASVTVRVASGSVVECGHARRWLARSGRVQPAHDGVGQFTGHTARDLPGRHHPNIRPQITLVWPLPVAGPRPFPSDSVFRPDDISLTGAGEVLGP
jgi:hypothetical protein